jgi:diaminopimelate decarboxylase
LGGYAEVVSGMEFDMALAAGVQANRIVFNGPYKGRSDMERALLAGATLNLESEGEAEAVEDLARRHPGRKFDVGLRCTRAPARYRDSFDVDGAAILDIFRRFENTNCRVAGLSCHS